MLRRRTPEAGGGDPAEAGTIPRPSGEPAGAREDRAAAGSPGRRWPGVAVAACLSCLLTAAGCWQTGEPTPGDALVTWAAYPETVVTGETFSFEFAGPVAPNTCGRLDTAVLAIGDSVIELSARRSTFERALCAKQRVSFYEARPIRLERPGRYRVRSAGGPELGTLVAVDTGGFSPMRAIGLGTIEAAGGCSLFGPGWAANQRPFALRGAPEEVTATAGSDRIVHVEGRVAGFTMCSWYGSRPTIRVDAARVTERRGADYY